MKFRFQHGALQTEDRAIFEKSGMTKTGAVSDQRIRHAAQIEQAIAVDVLARQAGGSESQHVAHVLDVQVRGVA